MNDTAPIADRLKHLMALRARATSGRLVVVPLDSQGKWFSLQTTHQDGGVIVGQWERRANAEYMAAAWEWLPLLIQEVRRLQESKDEAFAGEIDKVLAAAPVESEDFAPANKRNRYTRRRRA